MTSLKIKKYVAVTYLEHTVIAFFLVSIFNPIETLIPAVLASITASEYGGCSFFWLDVVIILTYHCEHAWELFTPY